HDVSTYHILWSDLVLIEEGALSDTDRTSDAEDRTSDIGHRTSEDDAERRAKDEDAEGGEEGDGEVRKESGGEEGREEEGEITDADQVRSRGTPAHYRKDLGGVSGSHGVHIRSASGRDEAADPARDRRALRREGH